MSGDWYVKPFYNHYILVVDGVEVCHCDTYREAVEEYNEYYLVHCVL